MKRLLLILSIACVTVGLSAQPAARRQQQQRQSNAENITTRARVTFPTAAPMSEDVVWRRDIYRELDLNTEANSGLYYPV